jgi:hypothetical protein
VTASEIPSPPNGWKLACRCGVPIGLGEGTFGEACLAALEHQKQCPVFGSKATVSTAIVELVTTVLWTQPEFYAVHRNLFFAAQKKAVEQGAAPVRVTGGCGACG